MLKAVHIFIGHVESYIKGTKCQMHSNFHSYVKRLLIWSIKLTQSIHILHPIDMNVYLEYYTI